MSFCRFSSGDYRSDFYAFESAGYELYVARNLVIWDPPPSAMTEEALQLPPDSGPRCTASTWTP